MHRCFFLTRQGLCAKIRPSVHSYRSTMSTYAPDRRNRMLTFAQLTYNTVAGSEDGTPIAEQLKAARRVARVVNRETAPLKMAWDFSDLSLIRVDADKITLFVRSAAQQNRLRQILPRISRGLGEAGFLQPAEIRIRPMPDKVDFTRPQALGKVRELSETAAAVINKKADSLEESALKDALKDLAATVLKKR